MIKSFLDKMGLISAKFKINYKLLAIILGAALLGYGLYASRGLLIVAYVDGKPISRLSVVKETERRAGEAILGDFINKILIDNEATAKKIVVTQDEVNSDLTKLEENLKAKGTNFETMLAEERLTRADFIKLLYTNKRLEKLIVDRIAVTDDEVNKYLEDNKAAIPEGQDIEALKPQVYSFLQQQKIDSETAKLIEELRAKAKIKYWIKY